MIVSYPFDICISVPLTDFSNFTSSSRRRLLQVQVTASDGTAEVPNPLICLELDELIIFRIWIAEDRTQSHYPVYIKDHLFNTNPDFDYGDFKQLEFYILETNVTYNSFAFQFTEPGAYVFADAQDLDRYVTYCKQC